MVFVYPPRKLPVFLRSVVKGELTGYDGRQTNHCPRPQ